MEGWLKQSTSITLRIGPFLDDADGKTAETALTISQADVRLSKAGGALAQKNDTTSCTHDENGYYSCPLNTTDTATLGLLKLAVSESGALPIWHTFMVVPANVFDSLFGTDKLQVHADEITAGLITATSIADNAITNAKINDGAISVTKIVDSSISAAKIATSALDGKGDWNVGKTGYSLTQSFPTNFADLAITVTTGMVTVGTNNDKTGYELIDSAITAAKIAAGALNGKGDWLLSSSTGSGLSAIPWNASWDAEVESECYDAMNTAINDATSLNAGSLLDRLRILGWLLRNKMEVTNASGNTTVYKDDSSTAAYTVNSALTDNSTTTTRLRIA